MSLVLTTPPALEPVLLGDLKTFLAIDDDDTSRDDLLRGFNSAARDWCETYTNRRFITQTWTLGMDFFPGYIDTKLSGQAFSSPFVSGANSLLVGIRYAIVLPYPPAQSVVSLSYLNANGGATTMNPTTDYVQDLVSQPARLTPVFGGTWPVARVVVNAVQVAFRVGYGDTGAAVPEAIKVAIKMLASYWLENRAPSDENIPMGVKAILGPYRDLRL